MAEICAPGVEFDQKVETCHDEVSLQKIAEDFNKKTNNQKIDINANKIDILNSLKDNIKGGSRCKEDFDGCLVDQKWQTDPYPKRRVIPVGPRGYEWLSTNDINNYLKLLEGYTQKQSGGSIQKLGDDQFKFLGTVPIILMIYIRGSNISN